MIQAPPTWLKAWRVLTLRLKSLMKEMIAKMMMVVNLGLMPRDVLQALPPMVDVKENPVTCNHSKCRRYGNAHGRFADCLQCGLKWVWNDKVKKWEDRVLKDTQKTGSKGRSTALQPLPAPSSATIAASSQAALQATCKTKPTRSRRESGVPSAHTMHQEGHWTNFYEMEHHLDHLSENQYLEAFNVMEQEPPFVHEPRNFFEMAFFNDEIYKADRLKMQHEADQKRWERLVELGVVSTEGDDIFDWEDVDSRL